MSNCNKCGDKIQFVIDPQTKKWIPVDDYVFDACERMDRRNKIPIPFDNKKHTKHRCQQYNNYSGVYRG